MDPKVAPPPPYAPLEMGIDDSSPSAPLLGGGSTSQQYQYRAPPEVVVSLRNVQEPSKNKCCGLSPGYVFVALCVCCCCIVSVFAGVFGSWAAKCTSVELYKTLEHETTFTGSEDKILKIRNNGDINLNPVTVGSRTVASVSDILAPSLDAANNVAVDFFGDSNTFSLIFPRDFWNCPQQDVTATLLDTAVLIAPILLHLESFSGNIVVGNFQRLRFNEAHMTSYNSKVTMGLIDIEGPLEITTNNNEITLTNVRATTAEVTNSNSPIILDNFSTESATITNLYGLIRAPLFTILPSSSSTTSCVIEINTSQAPVNITSLVFPTTSSSTPCQVSVRTSNADVVLTTSGFSGVFDLSGGSVSVPGHTCESQTTCTGTVGETPVHSLLIRTTGKSITLTFA